MGNTCCSKRAVVTVTGRRPSNGNTRRTSILLEQYSKLTDYKTKYEFVSILGNGGFGKVRLYRDRNCPDLKYAIKTLKKDFLNTHNIQSMIQEVQIINSLDHPNIVKYFETYDDYYLHIVIEYIPRDSLFKIISNRKVNGFTEKNAAEIISHLFKSISFVHSNKIVHRDIKPENILFSVKGNYKSLKLIDFGLSTSLATKDKYRVGSPYYMAPEMLVGRYDYATDMWSIGVILFVMMTGNYPFPGKDQQEVFQNIKKGVYDVRILEKNKASEEVKDLIKNLLVHDINKRIPIDHALKHPWFQKFLSLSESDRVIDNDILDSISRFAKSNILQKEILFYLAKISNDTEISKLKQAFLQIDVDKSGTIDAKELFEVFEKLGKSIDKVKYPHPRMNY